MRHHSPQLSVYLIPIFGTIPAAWTLYRQTGTSQQRAASRLSLMLALSCFLAYSLLGLSGSLTPSTVWSLRLLYLDGLITSGYFITCLALFIRCWQGKSPRLPGISTLANQLFRSRST